MSVLATVASTTSSAWIAPNCSAIIDALEAVIGILVPAAVLAIVGRVPGAKRAAVVARFVPVRLRDRVGLI